MNTNGTRGEKSHVRRTPSRGRVAQPQSSTLSLRRYRHGLTNAALLTVCSQIPRTYQGELCNGLIITGASSTHIACQTLAQKTRQTNPEPSFTFTTVAPRLRAAQTNTNHAPDCARAYARSMLQTSTVHRVCRQEKPAIMDSHRRHEPRKEETGNKYYGTSIRTTDTRIQGGAAA